VELRPVRKEIVIDRSERTLELRNAGHIELRTRVAVGAYGMETPLGRFYVMAKFRPTAPILGAFAFETSAYSKLSDWPGGGIVGIHGTDTPSLLGQAVSAWGTMRSSGWVSSSRSGRRSESSLSLAQLTPATNEDADAVTR
jgi:hypothetical protein